MGQKCRENIDNIANELEEIKNTSINLMYIYIYANVHICIVI